ncbi:LysR family transcriptional regulator [Sinirhodobacter huangdaonensis]|nr:LysR family transcriptional regulator [Sinirhodobacter huangdaonensis]
MLKQIDTRQLRVLQVLLEECSVTRAAKILDQSQPHVSLTLRKLREITGDPILVRSGSKLVPTERGLGMLAHVRAVLGGIDRIVGSPEVFDPGASAATFRLASADCMEAIFLPPLLQRLREQAPGARVVVRGIDASFDYAEALERDEIDAVICNWPGAPGHLKTAHLMTEDIVCLMGPQHPLAGRDRLSVEEYLSADHIAPVARSRADPGPIDLQLAEHGLRRDIQVMVAEFNLIPHILLASDVIFTSSARFAGYFESLMPLRSVSAPEMFGGLKFFLLWHERAQSDPRNIWLRGQITAVARSLPSVSG